jgi:hypothetical protein
MLTLRAAAGSLSPLRSDSVILSKKVLSFKFVSLKLVRMSQCCLVRSRSSRPSGCLWQASRRAPAGTGSVFQSILRVCVNLCNLWIENVLSFQFEVAEEESFKLL